ncbi:MAG: hypothetical protein HY819_25035 [Acidobacteria bacterium]|nr:hypothetical protein [Acidobacteriota bacterium]
MLNQTITQINTNSTIQQQTVVLLLNIKGFEPYVPVGCEGSLNLQIIAHNWVHLAQDNKHIESLGFWEELPEPEVDFTILPLFPEIPGLTLENANTAYLDGFLIYSGTKEMCYLAANHSESKGAFVKGNFRKGYKLFIPIERLSFNAPKFNLRSFAREAVMFRVYTLADQLGLSDDELSSLLQTRFGVRWAESLSPLQVKALIKQFSCIRLTKYLTRYCAA